ncbi:MAG: aminotransferase class I/II-fold pyridoxal phosphate-dependent enzyme [Deinococcus sp.]|uniref:aminotransferase class I/II-fold pyridoxal phosphate-dependent enzyme n=1 Tax=Deinococcus sp. TaxID=47478 RepID=UPI0026DCBA63|nr:aminotransferase class I/II-fold pyridoxal phosphate-dependent enzyme [Deinococcus sp.]MDO4244810.1 aminotransferase class I/II-fold pyridoxal phosphate-dependent enzyme [Deinococcus sp.]
MTNPSQDALAQAQAAYAELKARGLKLNLQRGQPADADFDLSNPMLSALGEGDTHFDGIDLRNYPGGIGGLPSARALFGHYLDLKPENVLVWNNSSLELQGLVLGFALLHGVRGSQNSEQGGGWVHQKPKMIVTVPGYDRHFLLLQTMGFELLTVDMQDDGPDVDAVEKLAANDPSVKGILFVPTYSNPGGETISEEKARKLAGLKAAAPDFTIFADDAYRAHHLFEERDTPVNFVTLCRDAGHPDRAFVFASTSKITFAGAGLGFVGSSEDNIAWLGKYLNAQSIGPNKVEQARHVKFLQSYEGGLEGLMRDHAALIAPKFQAVYDALSAELGEGGGGYATWRTPRGGYFISLDTVDPVADRVVQLADEAGISLTPAGATYPGGKDPHNANIRLAPTRPPLQEVQVAMRGVATCVKLAAEEYRAGR